MKIIVSEEIESVCPTFVGACVEANVVNTPYCQELWDEIHALGEKYKETLTTESLKEMSGIAATRKVYRARSEERRVGKECTVLHQKPLSAECCRARNSTREIRWWIW